MHGSNKNILAYLTGISVNPIGARKCKTNLVHDVRMTIRFWHSFDVIFDVKFLSNALTSVS